MSWAIKAYFAACVPRPSVHSGCKEFYSMGGIWRWFGHMYDPETLTWNVTNSYMAFRHKTNIHRFWQYRAIVIVIPHNRSCAVALLLLWMRIGAIKAKIARWSWNGVNWTTPRSWSMDVNSLIAAQSRVMWDHPRALLLSFRLGLPQVFSSSFEHPYVVEVSLNILYNRAL